MKERKAAEVVVLEEDVRVPGTDIILEKGDTIEIFPKGEEKKEEKKDSKKRSRSVLRKEFRDKLREKQAKAREAAKKEEEE